MNAAVETSHYIRRGIRGRAKLLSAIYTRIYIRILMDERIKMDKILMMKEQSYQWYDYWLIVANAY